jgi:FtsP/CotA-like multicopper oxidase with cupredoxin domain
VTSAKVRAGAAAAFCGALLLAGARAPVPAQSPTPLPVQSPKPLPPCLQQGKALLNSPVIRSHGGYLKATLRVGDGKRTLWGSDGENRCASQTLRYFSGSDASMSTAWPAGPDPIPGPTFRAKLGDLVEITFFNEVDPRNYSASLDRGTIGTREACDPFTFQRNGKSVTTSAGGDTMPDCLHGSSTTNVHFHGTHTTPNTTGDNILLFIRPALRTTGSPQPSEATAKTLLADFFTKCETKHPTAKATWPNVWSDLPPKWVALQASLLHQYDTTAVTGSGQPLPIGMQLGTVDNAEIRQGLWPQYQIGANPYCFPLPKYDATMRMGQSPGTHWYHAHKHGSTALNVANGMTGVFIIEGPYDDQLHAYYHNKLQEQVLMLQQLSTAPFPLITGVFDPNGPPGAPKPRISVNGRLNPVITMQRGEVQMWRIVNGAFRDAIKVAYFAKNPPPPGPPNPCATPSKDVKWRQIAQDGVQFNVANYDKTASGNVAFNLAAANRADALVKAPAAAGSYTLCIVRNIGLALQSPQPSDPAPPTALLTVTVGNQVSPAMDFITHDKFPTFPGFLKDITASEITRHRTITFASNHKWIDGKPFIDGHISQQMLLDTAEEWVVKNEANDKQHPFHIHINPFQIVELFEPNKQNQPCPIDPNDPTTFDPDAKGFKPCQARQPPGPWVWWDTFAIPAGQQLDITAQCPAKGSGAIVVADCPPQLQKYTQCGVQSDGNVHCIETVAGWFRSRSRFVDFTGQYVLHCHILIHEDRGMMQLIEVTAMPPKTDKSPYSHH